MSKDNFCVDPPVNSVPVESFDQTTIHQYIDKIKLKWSRGKWKDVPSLSIYVNDGFAAEDRSLKISIIIPYSDTGLEARIDGWQEGSRALSISFVDTISHSDYAQDIRRYLEAFVIDDISKIVIEYCDESKLYDTIQVIDDVINQQLKTLDCNYSYESELIHKGSEEKHNKCQTKLNLFYDPWTVVEFQIDGRLALIREFINLAGRYTLTIQFGSLHFRNAKWRSVYYLKKMYCCTTRKV